MSHQKNGVQLESKEKKERSYVQLWTFLEEAAALRIKELTKTLEAIAPRPGSLVYLEPRRPGFRLDGFEPVLFSVIDVCTHLQLARLYLTETIASAVDFLQFALEKFPFSIAEVRTPADSLFTDAFVHQQEHRFTLAATSRSITHSILAAPEQNPIMSILAKYLFSNFSQGSSRGQSQQKFMSSLLNFIYFHNNHRSLITLGGKTPLQALQAFPEFASVTFFNPYQAKISAKSQ